MMKFVYEERYDSVEVSQQMEGFLLIFEKLLLQRCVSEHQRLINLQRHKQHVNTSRKLQTRPYPALLLLLLRCNNSIITESKIRPYPAPLLLRCNNSISQNQRSVHIQLRCCCGVITQYHRIKDPSIFSSAAAAAAV